MTDYIKYSVYSERDYRVLEQLSFIASGSQYFFGTYEIQPKSISLACFRRDDPQSMDVVMVYNRMVRLNLLDRFLRIPIMSKVIDTGRIVRNKIIMIEREERPKIKKEASNGTIYDMQSERMRRTEKNKNDSM